MGLQVRCPEGRCDTAKKRLVDARLGFQELQNFHRITKWAGESVTKRVLRVSTTYE